MLNEDRFSSSLQQFCQILSGHLSPRDVPSEDWHALVAEAASHNLQPLLLWHIQQSGAVIPDALDEQLRQANHQAIAQSMLLHKAQRDIARALDGAGIPHIWLKGIVLSATIYPDPACRPMADLDVLVRPEQVTAALDCIQVIGYLRDVHSLFDATTLAAQRQTHHYVLRGGPAQSAVIELHYQLMPIRNRNLLPPDQADWFRGQVTRYVSGENVFSALSAEAHFLYLCEHMMLHHGLDDFVFMRPLDLHLLITMLPLNWEGIIAKATELHWAYFVERALQVTQELFQTPLPANVRDELRQQRPPERDIQRVEALARPGALVESIRWTLRSLGWRERVTWAGRVIAPPPGYMRSRYEIPNGRLVWPYYLRRWNHQLREVFTWMGSKRGTRSRS